MRQLVSMLLLSLLAVPAWAGTAAQEITQAAQLNQQAVVLYQKGKYQEAEPLFKRALAILEKAFGPDHPNVASSLNNLAMLYRLQGQNVQAELLYQRSLKIYEKALGPDHPDVASSLNNLAALYQTQGLYAQAEPLLLRALEIWGKALGSDHPDVAQGLSNLAELYNSQGLYAQAEPLYQRSLAILEKTLGPDHPNIATILNNLAALHQTQGQYALAEPLYKRALVNLEKALGPDHPDVASSLNNLAALYQTQGQYALAEPLYKRSLAILEKTLGPDHPGVAQSLNNLANLYKTQGQYALAEPFSQRSLAIWEKSLGPDHPDVAQSLNSLAEMYKTQGQYAQAEPLYKRALVILEKALGPDHPDVAQNLNNLATLHNHQGQYALAEPLSRRSLAILEKTFGPDHPDVAQSLNNLADAYKNQGKYAQAEPLYKRALVILEKTLGPDHPNVAASLNNLAALHISQGQSTQVEPLLKRALTIWEKALGPDHPDVAQNLNNLAALYQTLGQYEQALSQSRRASAIYRQRIIAGGTGDAAVKEASRNRSGFFDHLSLLSRNPGQETADKITDESFQIVQLEHASGTASAIAKMAARFASGDDALAVLAKRKQDASERRTKAEAQLVTASGKPPQERHAAAEKHLRDGITEASKEIETVDAELMRRFPKYQELTRPEPLSIGQIRALLKPGEAMLVYALDDNSFLWVVTPDGANFMPIQAKVKDVAAKVKTVLAEMEDETSRVSVGVLHELYKSLFAPAQPYLAGVQLVMAVPAGPLQSLPFSILIASPPPEIKTFADYRQVDWLGRHYAFAVLPSVSSIQAFRQFAKAGRSQEPFAGFGDPLIGGAGGKQTKLDMAMVYRNLAKKSNPSDTPVNAAITEIADVEAIRMAPRLSETADELRAMGKAFKAGPNAIFLRENATEANVKHLDLSKYRTIAFATHGVMAGEIEGVGEPGLILTPPRQGAVEDDGYLSSSEIAKLKLNADWVILSACNTAAADGTPGAEGLSGLAKAFFYAGARSLLVSHWPVASEATVLLTTAMLREYEAQPGEGKAKAQQKAMMTLIDMPDHPEYAHPLFWAPFMLVGEGGAESQAK